MARVLRQGGSDLWMLSVADAGLLFPKQNLGQFNLDLLYLHPWACPAHLARHLHSLLVIA